MKFTSKLGKDDLNNMFGQYQLYTSDLTGANDLNKLMKITLDYVERSFIFTYFGFMRTVGNRLRTVGFRGYRSMQPLSYEFNADGIAEIFTRVRVDDLAKLEGGDPLDGRGICVRAFTTQESQLIDDIRLDSDYIEAPIISEMQRPTLSELAVPIIVEGVSFGVLNLESDELGRFTEQDKNLLESVAEHVSSTFSKLRYQSHLKELQGLAITYSEVSDIENLIQLTLTAMDSFFEASICDFMINLEGMLRSVGVVGPSPPEDSPLSFDDTGIARAFFSLNPEKSHPMGGLDLDSTGITVRAFNTKTSQLVNDVKLDPDYIDYSDTVIGETDLTTLSELAVPIIIDDTAFGVLNLESQKLNSFSSQDMELLDAISKLVSSSVKRLNLERENEENIYRSILESGLDGVGVIEDGVYIYANNSLASILGYERPEEVVGRKSSDLMSPVIQDSRDAVPRFESYLNEYYGLTRDGTEFYLEARSNGISYLGRGCTLEFYRDITEKRKMEVALASQEQEIRELLERHSVISDNLHSYASRLAVVSELNEIVQITKNTVRNVFEFERVGLGLVKDDSIRFISVDQPAVSSKIPIDGPGITARAVRTGKTQIVNDTAMDPDYISLRGDGSKSGSELVVPIWMSDELVGVIDIATEDVDSFTQQDVQLVEIFSNHIASALARSYTNQLEKEVKNQNELLQKQNKKLMELDDMKSSFIVTATHELRTPVTAILGYADFMLSSGMALNEEQEADLTVILRNSKRLVLLTDDLLDIQRIQTGRLSMNVSEFDLVQLADEIVQELDPLFNGKTQLIKLSRPDELIIKGDRHRISQALINILSNANKFSPVGGEISFSLCLDGDQVKVSIKDSGIGMQEEDLDKLFKPFPGIQHGLEVKSTGLGLSICKGIVDLHGGEIWAESEGLGNGSTFMFTIPVER